MEGERPSRRQRSPTALISPTGAALAAGDAKVLRGFIRDDRLTVIPAQAGKREVVLRYLLERCFPEDREYPEKEVNQRLALFHPDVAALRRYLVEGRLMTRAAGRYRRARSLDAGGEGPQAS